MTKEKADPQNTEIGHQDQAHCTVKRSRETVSETTKKLMRRHTLLHELGWRAFAIQGGVLIKGAGHEFPLTGRRLRRAAVKVQRREGKR